MEKGNYKIKFNSDLPSSEQIKAHQDFDSVLAKYNDSQSPGPSAKHKTGKIIKRVFLAAAAAIGLLVMGISLKGKKDKAVADNGPYVNPPMQETIPEEVFAATVEANQGGRIVFKSGTVAVVPPKAFANRAGELVAGPVEVKIKEYHDYIDFFLSGIPMEYDSLGVKYQLESAGMIEIYAEQDGRRLNMIPEKAIEIELKSSVMVKPGSPEPKFNIYELDQDNKNWKYVTRDQMVYIDNDPTLASKKVASSIDEIEKEQQAEIKAIKKAIATQLTAFEENLAAPKQPQKPQKANTDNPTFDLMVDKLVVQNNVSQEEAAIQNDEAALRDLRNTYAKSIWEVMPGQATWSPAIANTQWDDYDIRTNGDGNFTVTFIKNGSKVDVQVKPVLVGKDYKEALKKFNQEFAVFQEATVERQAKIDTKRAELEEIKAAKLSASKLTTDEKIAALQAAGLKDQASNEMIKREVLNRFSVTNFGIWNCDRPLPPFISSLKATFVDQHNTEYDGPVAFMVDKNRNSVAKFNAKKGVQVQYNLKSNNLMWFVTKENKIAVYRPEEFNKINHRLGKHTFVMNLEEQEISSEDDIREILKFD